MRIVAVDPGYERLGIAVIEKIGGQKEKLIYSDCFFTDIKTPHGTRLAEIGLELERVIQEYKPVALSIETLFFSKNTKTALKVAEARGTLLFVAAKNNLAIHEFTPMQIKIAVTGHGGSAKDQVTFMVKKLISIPEKISKKTGKKEKTYDDEYDAIAAGLTFFAIVKPIYPQK